MLRKGQKWHSSASAPCGLRELRERIIGAGAGVPFAAQAPNMEIFALSWAAAGSSTLAGKGECLTAFHWVLSPGM